MSPEPRPPILDRMAALADGLRGRILLLLEGRELTVGELCAILQLPQSTVSRHLKALGDVGFIEARREATSRFYHLSEALSEPGARRLWQLAREAVDGSPPARLDAQRLPSVLARRRSRSVEFFADAADGWDGLRDELFGPGFYLAALPALLDRQQVVADLGCGSGAVAHALAPFVERVIAVDGSSSMLEAAADRLAVHRNVELRRGDLEALPIEDGQADAATLVLVLHHVAQPAKVVAEAARVVRPGGRVLIVDMLPHDRHAFRQEMGHVWLGFSDRQIAGFLSEAGLAFRGFHPLPPTAPAKGPALFVASAARPQPGAAERMDLPTSRTSSAEEPARRAGAPGVDSSSIPTQQVPKER